MILGAHPQITYYDENGPYPIAVFRRREYSRSTPHVGLKLTTLTPEASKFKRENPDMKFLFLTRGILSTCSSMLKLNWVKPLILGDEMQRSIDNLYPSEYKAWVIQKFLEYNYSSSAHKLAALYAQVRFNFLYEYDAYQLSCRHIIYERLVTNPEAIINHIAEFVGVEFHPNMLNHATQYRNINIHGTAGDRAIDTDSISKYKGDLNRSQQTDILDISTQAHDLAIQYYTSFGEYKGRLKPSEAIENHAAQSDPIAIDLSPGNLDPFKFAKVTVSLSEREKLLVNLYEQGCDYEEMARSLNTDLESVKMELASLLHRNDQIEQFYSETSSLSKTICRAHLIN
jgi:hypothetical protein